MAILRDSVHWEQVFEELDMGFIPIGNTYVNLDILVIGLNEPRALQGSAKELSIIQRYWSTFFEEMGVKYQFISLNSPAANNIIREFLAIE